MPHDLPTLLLDLRQTIADLESFMNDGSFAEYQRNLLLRRGVERQFEIIGEILKRIRDTSPQHFSQITDARSIIDFRNIIAHGYDVVSDRLVYDAAVKSLPVLKVDVERLIQDQ